MKEFRSAEGSDVLASSENMVGLRSIRRGYRGVAASDPTADAATNGFGVCSF